MEHINWIVAASNIFGFIAGFGIFRGAYPRAYLHAFLVIIASVLSTLMHLSETKHSLPGIAGFREYTNLFLNMDRLFSYGLGGYVAWYVITEWKWKLMTFGMSGILACAIGEIVVVPVNTFAILHVYWHFVAYTVMYTTF